ncbi:CoA-acylating methylmalonate-semialdehyde dehydrogenase [Acidiplasma aeolicum]|jgi:malonate-semialdehyde dehydrogenase (acetylating)/methylmalonate-semialdehyde dehydrogenase|uniref:CoA-acylating methylmalonate-semialdehyde dehydrogenase n=1 Tax=Acidiplasma aeolicum TaxID=507754 RepID=UPI003718160C
MKTENMEYKVFNYVNGQRVENNGKTEYRVFNPAFGKQIASVFDTGAEDVNKAVDYAYDAFLKWSKIPITDRIKYLFRLENLMRENADELAKMVTIEHGKTFKEAQGEVLRAIENVEAACSSTYNIMGKNNKNISAGIDEELIRVPMGVFAAITPFNFPIMVAFWFIPYAIGLGNTIIVKPSEKTPLTMQKTLDLFDKAGFPPGVISVVNGAVDTVNALLNNDKIVGVSFVGSTGAAKYIVSTASAKHKRSQAGASAKNYELVMPDADPEKVVPHLISSFYGNAGERCLAGSVLVTLPENHDKIVNLFKKQAQKLILGYGLDENVTLGPLIRSEHRERVLGYIDSGISEGAKLILDGRTFDAGKYRDGFFLGPSIFDDASTDMKIIREEIFGPVASVIEAKDFDDAIEIINKSQYGNASTIFTNSGTYAERFTEEVQAGNIGVNIGVAAPIAFYPFAGYKNSFFGDLHAQGGPDHVMFFTDSKVIIKRW